MKSLFEKSYPNIARWINEHEGLIEIGYDVNSPLNSFIRIFDEGGMYWEGKNEYESLDEAWQEADQAILEVLKDIYGE
jgi:hypothetical protein